jgi:hypothetical protein
MLQVTRAVALLAALAWMLSGCNRSRPSEPLATGKDWQVMPDGSHGLRITLINSSSHELKINTFPFQHRVFESGNPQSTFTEYAATRTILPTDWKNLPPNSSVSWAIPLSKPIASAHGQLTLILNFVPWKSPEGKEDWLTESRLLPGRIALNTGDD